MRFLTGLTTLAAASFGCWANASQPEPLNAPAATEIAVNGVFSEELEKQFYDGALAIARKKIAEGEEFRRSHPETAAKILPRLATGGGFGGLFVWDTAFCVLWAKYDADELPVTTSLDNFYRLQRDDGFICREFQADGTPCWGSEHPMSWNPPILAWAEWELFQSGVTDAGRLKKVYPALKKNHEFCRKTYRRPDGLYFSDALGGGMDNLPRLPIGKPYDLDAGIRFKQEYACEGFQDWAKSLEDIPLYNWNKQMGWIDTSSQMALNALNLSKIAEAIGETADAAAFRQEHAALAEAINDKCYDPERGFYFDYYDGEVIPRYHIGALWTLIAEVVPPERLPGILAVINDPAKFNRPVPFPCLAADEPEYDPENGYWLGSSWPCTTYMALRGLQAVGEEALARQYARRYYNACLNLYLKTDTIWENISPEQCDQPKQAAGSDFCGWGALAPIAVYREFIQDK